MVLFFVVTARAFAILGLGDIVCDPTNYGELVAQLSQMAQEYDQLIRSYQLMRTQYDWWVQMGQTIPQTLLNRWRTPVTPWSTFSAEDSYGSLAGWMQAVNQGVGAAAGYKNAAEALLPDASALSRIPADQVDRIKNAVVETGADPAATDCNRVLRVPGFYNHKYAPAHFVSLEAVSREIYKPEHFQKFLTDNRTANIRLAQESRPRKMTGGISQSERDWAFAKRALARGDSEELVTAAIANFRRNDKPDPEYYARHTVQKAAEAVRQERESNGGAPER